MAKEKNPKSENQVTVVCAFIVFMLVVGMAAFVFVGPYKDYQKSKNRLASLKDGLQLAQLTRAEEALILLQEEEIRDRIMQRAKRFELGTFMGKVIRESGLDDRSEMKGSKLSARLFEHPENLSKVDLKLNGITLTTLVDFLHKVYDSKNLIMLYKLNYVRVGRGDKGLDCDLSFVAPKN